MKIAVFADIHANIDALQNCIDDAGIVDEFWCLGDLCGYGPSPVETIEAARNYFQDRIVLGNHDLGMVPQHPVSRNKDKQGSTSKNDPGSKNIARKKKKDSSTEQRWLFWEKNGSKDAEITWILHREILKQNEILWNWCQDHMTNSNASSSRVLKYEGICLLLAHSTYRDFGIYHYPWKYYLSKEVFQYIIADDKSMKEGENILQFVGEFKPQNNITMLVTGHTHIPMLAKYDPDHAQELKFMSFKYGKEFVLEPGVYLANPGSVGFSYDGDHRPSYLLLDHRNSGNLTIEFRRPDGNYYNTRKKSREWITKKLSEIQLPPEEEWHLRVIVINARLDKAIKKAQEDGDLTLLNAIRFDLGVAVAAHKQENEKNRIEKSIKELDDAITKITNEPMLADDMNWSVDLTNICVEYLPVNPHDEFISTYKKMLIKLSGGKGDYQNHLSEVYTVTKDGYLSKQVS